MNEELIEIKYAKKTNNKCYKKYEETGWKAEKFIEKLRKDENITTILVTTYTELNKTIFYKIGGNN